MPAPDSLLRMDEWVEPFMHIMCTTVDTKPLDAFSLMLHAPNYLLADLVGFISSYHIHHLQIHLCLTWNGIDC